jgi:gas vesicle protein
LILRYDFRTWKTAAMSEHSVPLGHDLGSGDSDRAGPVIANLQQSANLANDNCDRAVALAQTLSAQLREAQDRINQLEREAEGLGDQLLAEAKAIIQEVRSNADARVNRTIREANERVDRLKAEAQNQIGRLQNELSQARRENEDKVLRLEADLTQANNRAHRAEQCLMLIRREIEEHLMPAMRDGPEGTDSVARPQSLMLPTRLRSSAIAWFRRLWLRVTSTAALGCRVRDDIELETKGLSARKPGNTAAASEPSAPLQSGGNSAGLSSAAAR